MDFDATPLNITTLLVVTIAIIALVFLCRGRHDSNLPLLFYGAAFMLINLTDRAVNGYLMYTGLVVALILRFEFMGKGFTKFINFLAVATIGLIAIAFVDQAFGGNLFS